MQPFFQEELVSINNLSTILYYNTFFINLTYVYGNYIFPILPSNYGWYDIQWCVCKIHYHSQPCLKICTRSKYFVYNPADILHYFEFFFRLCPFSIYEKINPLNYDISVYIFDTIFSYPFMSTFLVWFLFSCLQRILW